MLAKTYQDLRRKTAAASLRPIRSGCRSDPDCPVSAKLHREAPVASRRISESDEIPPPAPSHVSQLLPCFRARAFKTWTQEAYARSA